MFTRRDTKPELFQIEAVSRQRGDSNMMNVSKIIVHNGFSNSPALRNDIALFKLDSNFIYPSICLNKQQPSGDNNLCYVAGWGSVDGTGKIN